MASPHLLLLRGISDTAAPAGGSGEDFSALLERHAGDLKAFIASLTREASLCADLYQETARTLWTAFDNYDPSLPFGAWARGVARNIILRQRRHAFREAALFSPAATDAIINAWDSSESEICDDRMTALQECLAALPEESRGIITQFYASRTARAADIARRLGRSTDAVYQLLTRTRARLAACIRERLRRHERSGD